MTPDPSAIISWFAPATPAESVRQVSRIHQIVQLAGRLDRQQPTVLRARAHMATDRDRGRSELLLWRQDGDLTVKPLAGAPVMLHPVTPVRTEAPWSN